MASKKDQQWDELLGLKSQKEKELSELEKKREALKELFALKQKNIDLREEVNKLRIRKSKTTDPKEKSLLRAALMMKKQQRVALLKDMISQLKGFYKDKK